MFEGRSAAEHEASRLTDSHRGDDIIGIFFRSLNCDEISNSIGKNLKRLHYRQLYALITLKGIGLSDMVQFEIFITKFHVH
jgi:hypothetical protein